MHTYECFAAGFYDDLGWWCEPYLGNVDARTAEEALEKAKKFMPDVVKVRESVDSLITHYKKG